MVQWWHVRRRHIRGWWGSGRAPQVSLCLRLNPGKYSFYSILELPTQGALYTFDIAKLYATICIVLSESLLP